MSVPPEQVYFNREAAMYLLWLDSNPALRVIDINTNFQTAAFVNDKISNGIWQLFIKHWATKYTGFPHCLRVDRESSFQAYEFRDFVIKKDLTLSS